jgi:O-antigen/teichoic acid export membrane protein
MRGATRGRGVPLALNGVYAILQTGTNVLALFWVYRLIAHGAGVATLGSWSLTLGIASLASFGDLGASDAIVREVARLRSQHPGASLSRPILIGALFSFISIAFVGAVFFPTAAWLVARLSIAGPQGWTGIVLGACSLVAALNAVTNALLGAMEGYERYDLKVVVSFAGGVAIVTLTAALVPSYGLYGLAAAFVGQGVVTVGVGILVVCILSSGHRLSPFLNAPEVLKRLVTIGIPMRLAGASALFFEPVTRYVLANFGGAALVGVYEAASRLASQTRALIVAGIQVLVPRLSALRDSAPDQSLAFFRAASRATMLLSTAAFGGVALGAPLIGALIFPEPNRLFHFYSLVLGAAWLANALVAPTYFANIAEGRLKWNLIGQWMAVALNGAIGMMIGRWLQPELLVLAPVVSLIGSTCVLLLSRKIVCKVRIFYVGVPEAILLAMDAMAGAFAVNRIMMRTVEQGVQLVDAIALVIFLACAATLMFFGLKSMTRQVKLVNAPQQVLH